MSQKAGIIGIGDGVQRVAVIAKILLIIIITYILCPCPSHVHVPVEVASLLPSWWRTLHLLAGFKHHASILWLLLLLLGGSHLALLWVLLIPIALLLVAIVLLVAVALVSAPVCWAVSYCAPHFAILPSCWCGWREIGG